ncbi:MAG: 4-(cytidine 5'-diphospho)-2-C-methyl-D-erythritol kinase [Thermoguttaceae bacterium]
MYIEQNEQSWTAYPPAKLNLFFEVYGKRGDGFHEVQSVAVPIRLFDRLIFTTTETTEIVFSCFGGGPDIPNGADNIVLRAISLLQHEMASSNSPKNHQFQKTGAKIELFKQIPSQAGLGGGSSDAAAALLCARNGWQLDISDEKLAEIAASIGSDCPIFLHEGAVHGKGRGEQIESVQSPPLHFVLFKPNEGLATSAVYKDCMSLHDGIFRKPDDLLEAMKRQNLEEIGPLLFNRLESSARKCWKRFDEIAAMFEPLDCLAVRMSGSGTTFFGLCRNFQHAHSAAAILQEKFRNEGVAFAVSSL